MDEEELSLQETFCYIEWTVLVLTVLVQLAWMKVAVHFHWLMVVSIALLVVAALVVAVTPKTTRGCLIHLLAQILVVSLSCALGMHRRFAVYFLVLGAKAAALLPRKQMLFAEVVLLAARLGSDSCSRYLMENVYIHRYHVPAFYTSTVSEMESKSYFLIGLLTVILLGRTIVAVRKSREIQKVLGKEAEQLAVEFEHKKIAQDIHTSLEHSLISQVSELEQAAQLVGQNKLDEAQKLVSQSYDSASQSLERVRETVKAMRSNEKTSGS
jgi:signal transduction histidine kinase